MPAKKREEVNAVICTELDISRDLSSTHSFSNGDYGPHEHKVLRVHPCGSQPRTGTRSTELEKDIENYTKFEKQGDLVKLSNPTKAMLSSTMVTVLAPHWTGRLRRVKRFEETGNSEAQGNIQDTTDSAANHTGERIQESVDMSLTDGSQAQFRVPFLSTRRNTVGCLTKSGPASLDYETKGKMIQSISLDVNSGRIDNRKRDASALSPVATGIRPISTLSLVPSDQRRNPQTGGQGGLSSLSSKPTTSSLLLSLRRFNTNGRNANEASNLSEMNPPPLSSLPSDQDEKLFTTHLSPTCSYNNNNAQERSKSLISSSSSSYRTAETVPVLSPSSSIHRERTTFERRFFSASPTNKDTEDNHFIQKPQSANRTQSSLTSPKQAFLSRGPPERRLNGRSLDKSTNLLSGSSVPSSRHSPYDHSTLLKTHSNPGRTPLTSTSWLRQGTQEGSSPPTFSDTTNKDIKKPNTTLAPPCNNKTDLTSPSLIGNKRFSGQFTSNKDNTNTTESVCKSNMNVVMNAQEGTHNLKLRKAEDLPDHESERLVKQQYDSSLNREQQKPHSLPNVTSSSKISKATVQTKLGHHNDLSKHNGSGSSFTANVTELPSFQNPKSSNAPTESCIKYSNNHCTVRTNNTPTSLHNKDLQRFTKPSLSLATTNTTSGLPLTSNTKTSSSFHSHPVASQTNISAPLYTSSSSQTTRLTNTAYITPLGFERTYTSVLKPFHPKTLSSPVSTVSAFTKTNHSFPVFTASTISSSTTGSHPAATTDPSPSLLSSPVTPVLTSSPTISIPSLLTPPATPIITSPNYSDTSSLKEGRTASVSQERDTKKQRSIVEGKRVRRVTWEDSVDLQHSVPIAVEKPEPSQVPTSSPSPSRSPRCVKAPSIFSFLRSGSPTTNTSSICSPTPKTSSTQAVNGVKYRSLSSDSADIVSREQERSKHRPSYSMISDHGVQDRTTLRQERTLSVESGTVHCRSSSALSLPPDFSSGYKLRYSSPPYSTLMSTRSTQGETKTPTPRSPLFQQPSQSNFIQPLYQTDSTTDLTLPTSNPSLSPINLPQPQSLPLQNRTATQSSKYGVSEIDQLSNNHSTYSSRDSQKGQISLVSNRVQVSSQSLQSDNEPSSSPTFVTETLVYSIKSKEATATVVQKNTTPKPLQHTTNALISLETTLGQQSHMVQSKEATDKLHCHSHQNSSGSSSMESQPSNDESSNRRRESSLGKSRFFSVESNNEQSPKRSRFALKKSVSTPNSSLSKSESDRASKTNNKMDQVINRLRQTFSARRSDDDMSFPWKWKRTSQTPSISGCSDISNVSDISCESAKTPEMQDHEKEVVLKDNEKRTEVTNRWTQNKCTLTPPSSSGSTMAGDKFYIWSDKSTPETDRDRQNACTEYMSESKKQPHLTVHSPKKQQCDFYKDNGTDYKPTNQFLPCRDPSPGRSPNASAAYPSPFGKSTPSPRSPFSPFSSLSPLSSFPSPDITDDSVFYSPKLQRRKESLSPCEPAEGVSLGGSRRSRASTRLPSASPGHDLKSLESSYADLKYGIEPGRSFSVSSVLSSRPSGPGRISTGSRFMSVGNLSETALTSGGTGKDLDHWSVTPDWNTEYDCQPNMDYKMSCFPTDTSRMRSRSLPRSLTRRLANWSSGVSAFPPVKTKTSMPIHLWSPNMNTCQFAWDTEGPPTPPPTPPLSPVSRRMSKPCSPSSPPFPSSSEAPQQVDSQSPRGRLPSRGYVSSLSTFEESSDSNSDTTTDDEYYLETGEEEEKETEL